MKVKVNTPVAISAVVNTQGTSEVVAIGIQGPMGPSGSSFRLGDVSDVDASNLNNGSLLVYKTSTSKWTSTTELNQQTLESGEY